MISTKSASAQALSLLSFFKRLVDKLMLLSIFKCLFKQKELIVNFSSNIIFAPEKTSLIPFNPLLTYTQGETSRNCESADLLKVQS